MSLNYGTWKIARTSNNSHILMENLNLCFSPTSDTLMVISGWHPLHIYLWRLDTQEMVSFSCGVSVSSSLLHVIHSPLTNYLFILWYPIVEIWDVSATGSKMIWKHALLSDATCQDPVVQCRIPLWAWPQFWLCLPVLCPVGKQKICWTVEISSLEKRRGTSIAWKS